MLKFNRMLLLRHSNPYSTTTRASFFSCQQQQQQQQQHVFSHEEKNKKPFQHPLPSQHFYQKTSTRFFDIHQLGSKEAIETERARLKDEMSRGYFADMSEFKQHGGKIATANKIIIPAMAAVKFPDFEVNYSDGRNLKLPVRSDANTSDIPKASLLCLSFRASSQRLIDSWSIPFLESFHDAKNIHLYQVSFIDSWFLSRNPIKKLLLRIMRKPNSVGNDALQKQMVYSFGDHYYLRKELRVLNLLTGYIFLLDKFGRIRWQGFGLATQEELSSLFSCTRFLLEEE